MKPTKATHGDAALIQRLGGAAKVAVLLGMEKDGGTQRVYNWLKRGIPPRIKLQYPALFLASAKSEQEA